MNIDRLRILAILLLTTIGSNAIAQKSDFQKWDENGDNRVSRSELPKQLRGNFARVDSNNDGFISLDEHKRFLSRRTRNNQAKIPDNVRAQQHVPYVTDGHERQKLDIYIPKTESNQPRPLVVWIHGGGWKNGNRFPCPALFLTQHGYAVASLGYRLTDAAIFPAQIHDCKSAIRYLRKNASELGVDPDRFGVWGSSAGGHLVALCGTSGNAPQLEGTVGVTGQSSSVQAVCDYYGPTDLLKMASQSDPNPRIDHDAPDSPESKLLGGPIQQKPDLGRLANPITHVDGSDPPFLIVHGDADPLVPHQQSRMLHDALKAANVPSELVIVPGGGHGPFRNPEQLQRVRKFFDTVLHP